MASIRFYNLVCNARKERCADEKRKIQYNTQLLSSPIKSVLHDRSLHITVHKCIIILFSFSTFLQFCFIQQLTTMCGCVRVGVREITRYKKNYDDML